MCHDIMIRLGLMASFIQPGQQRMSKLWKKGTSRDLTSTVGRVCWPPKSHDLCCHFWKVQCWGLQAAKLQNYLRFKEKHLVKTTNYRNPQRVISRVQAVQHKAAALRYTSLLETCDSVSHPSFSPWKTWVVWFEHIKATLSTLLRGSGGWLIKSCGQRHGERTWRFEQWEWLKKWLTITQWMFEDIGKMFGSFWPCYFELSIDSTASYESTVNLYGCEDTWGGAASSISGEEN